MSAELKAALVILRRKQVEARTGLSRSAIYASIKSRTFPAPVSLLGGRAVGWVEAEINEWLEARVSARDALMKRPAIEKSVGER